MRLSFFAFLTISSSLPLSSDPLGVAKIATFTPSFPEPGALTQVDEEILRVVEKGFETVAAEMEAKGYLFRSQSDTEVLLHLYADRGAEMVHALRGMFAFGIWDARERTLVLARDRFGEKPLLYHEGAGGVTFASELAPLSALMPRRIASRSSWRSATSAGWGRSVRVTASRGLLRPCCTWRANRGR